VKLLALATIALTALGTRLVMPRDAAPSAAPARPVAPIVVAIPAPTLVMVHALPAPLPPPAAEPPPALSARATAPILDATCIIPVEGLDEMPSCTWDTGFPAISADGTTLVVEAHPGDGGRGYPSYDIELIDVADPRKRTSYPILVADEYAAPDDPAAPANRAKAERRIAKMQRLLDAGGYRTIVRLGSKNEPLTSAPGFRTEYHDERVRLIDTATNSVLWERRFDVTREFPWSERDIERAGETCKPTSTSSTALAWDPTTHTLLAQVGFMGGPCWCDEEILAFTYHLP
jgi:hypothetical protein